MLLPPASPRSLAPSSPAHSTLLLSTYVGHTIFIFAAALASGGHLNPTITIGTFFAGLATLARAVLCVVALCTGALVGAYWLRLDLGNDVFLALVSALLHIGYALPLLICVRALYRDLRSTSPRYLAASSSFRSS